jgi:phage baseplate assembly protein W
MPQILHFRFYFLKVNLFIEYLYVMAQKTYINIQFPFQNDSENKFLELTRDAKRAIKSDLIHLLLTNKGERLYMPNFGANLRQYLFEPNDDIAANAIKTEINNAIKEFLPNLQVTELSVTKSEDNEHAVLVRIDYIVTLAALQSTDFVVLEL